MDVPSDSPERIERLISEANDKGRFDEIDSWLYDSSRLPSVISVLDYQKSSKSAIFFSIKYLETYAVQFFDSWAMEEQRNFTIWILDHSFANVARYVADQTLMSFLSKVIGSIFSHGWDTNPEFPQIFEHLFTDHQSNENELALSLSIMASTAESAVIDSIVSFHSTHLFRIFEKGFMCLRQYTDQPSKLVIFNSLSAILNSIRFDATDPRLEDFTSKFLVLQPQWHQFCSDYSNASLIFQILLNGTSDIQAFCLDILICLSYLSPDSFASIQAEHSFYFSFLGDLTLFVSSGIQRDNFKAFFGLTLLIVRLKCSIDKRVEANKVDFSQLSECVYRITLDLVSSNSILEDEASIQNLIQFWSSFSTINAICSGDANCDILTDRKYQILVRFIESSLKGFETDNQPFVAAFLTPTSISQTLISFSSIFDVPKSIEYLANLVSECLSDYLCEINERRQAINIVESRLAFTLQASIGLSAWLRIKVSDSDLITSLASLYSSVLFAFSQSIFGTEPAPMIQTAFLAFSHSFVRSDFLSQFTTVSSIFYSSLQTNGAISSIEQLLDFIFDGISRILHSLDQNIVYSSTQCLKKLFRRENSFSKLIFKLPSVQRLISERISSSFPFLSLPEHSRNRSSFHSALGRILFDSSEVCQAFLHTYDHVFEDPSQLWGLFQDFSGLFDSAVLSSSYLALFDFLYPNFLQFIASNAASMAQPEHVNSLLKFWKSLVNNEPRRIVFKHHSPNGVILFQMTTSVLSNLVNRLIGQVKLTRDSRESVKFMYRCFQIITSSLLADYVPFSAFEIYNDDTLKRLLQCFVRCISAVNVSDLPQLPKVEAAVQQAAAAVCGRHLAVYISIDAKYTDILTEVLISGVKSSQRAICQISIKGFSNLIQNLPAEVLIDGWYLEVISFLLWGYLLSPHPPSRTEICGCLRSVYARYPTCIEVVHERIAKSVDEKSSDDFESSFSEFRSSVQEAMCGGIESDFDNLVIAFAQRATSALKRPQGVFILEERAKKQ